MKKFDAILMWAAIVVAVLAVITMVAPQADRQARLECLDLSTDDVFVVGGRAHLYSGRDGLTRFAREISPGGGFTGQEVVISCAAPEVAQATIIRRGELGWLPVAKRIFA